MGVKISGEYLGDLATKMQHGPSGVTLQTDPPVDNGGSGASFSPTDLLATAYGSCMMSIIAIRAKKERWYVGGMKISIEKHMTASPPRKVKALDVALILPVHLNPSQRQTLIDAARNCPVALSVADSMEINFRVDFV